MAACGKKEDRATLPAPLLAKGGQAAPERVRLRAAQARRLSAEIRVMGTAVAVRAANLGPAITGRIMSLGVQEGDTVRAGQALARIDARAIALGMQRARAGATAARVQADQMETEVNRLEPLAAQGTVPQQRMDQLTAQRQAAQAGAEAAQAAVAEAQNALGNTTLRAPFDGIVAGVMMEVGETATLMPPSVILRIVDLSELEVRAQVPERDIGALRVGAPVHAHFTSAGQDATGTVWFIGPEIDPRTRSATVIARIPNPDRALRAGLSVEVTIQTGEPHDGVVVPLAAISTHGDQSTVFVVEGGVAHLKTVTLRLLGDGEAEALTGVRAGESVVVPFRATLSEGAAVTPEVEAPTGGPPTAAPANPATPTAAGTPEPAR